MKNTFTLLLLFTALQIFSQTSTCENSSIHFDKFYGDLSSAKKVAKSFDVPIRKTIFNFALDTGKKDVVVVTIVGEGGTEEQPDYAIRLTFHQSKLKLGESTKIKLIDNWNTVGLDTEESAIVQFFNLHNWGAQWSNWGGHVIGESEGEINITLVDEKTLCGSVTFKTYADGSSMNSDFYSSGFVKNFVATKIE